MLLKDKFGKLKCTACMLCAENCPAKCINIVIKKLGKARMDRKPLVFEIDSLKCIFCGECIKACPIDAIKMTDQYKLGQFSGSIFKWSKEFLGEK
ncbi:MAG: 4Fe-4S binding protein [Pseudomonadota bacterium]